MLAAPRVEATSETAVRLVLRPMAAPKPALKYQLLPEVRELQAGNPVQWYLRSFAEQQNFFFAKESVADRDRYRTMPLKDVPGYKLKGYGGYALTQADWGARLDTPDWQALDRLQNEGPDLTLPVLDSLRVLGEALQVRFRGEVARRDFDAAIVTAKTMLALARHLGEFPASAASRLGLAIAGMALDTLTEMIQQPDCPNLYWALTDLPGPLVDIRKGLQADRVLADVELKSIHDDAMTAEEIEELVARVSGRVGFAREQSGSAPRSFRATVTARVQDAKGLTDTRLRLVAAGCWSAVSLPPTQVILLDAKRAFEIQRDDEMKLLGLAPWQIEKLTDGQQPQGTGLGLFADLIPHVRGARAAQARLDQRVAILRHVEALRMHAAHHGKLPSALEEVDVPLPVDPFTGKPFSFALDGKMARLCAAAARGMEKPSPAGACYEITIKTGR